MTGRSDAIVIGAGLAGLVAAAELVEAGKRVTIVDQEPEATFGGQAWWSFGGVFLVDSPEQRRMGIRDSIELAQQDWAATAGFDRPEDDHARQWAESYLDFASGEKEVVAAREGRAVLPRRRLGRAQRRHRHGARQLGAALPHRVGQRAWHP